MDKKIYDFPFEKVKSQVSTAFKKAGQRATVADLISQTGLAKYQVESVVPALVDECRGQMQVTQSGEILYYFPKGMSNQKKGFWAGWKRFWSAFTQISGKILTFLFKIWIMVMLVGYFIIFLALFVLALVASIAASMAKRDDRDRGDGGGLGFYFAARLIGFFIELWIYSGAYNKKAGKKVPFYKSVFAFVFGVEPPAEEWLRMEKKAFISLVQKQKGSITLEEVMALTGRDRAGANELVTRFLLEYEGEPLVSDEGTLYYFFPELLKLSRETESIRLGDRPLIPFSHNQGGTNRWIVFFNAFNAVFGAYFLYFGLWGDPSSPAGLVYYFTIYLLQELGFGRPEGLVTLVLGLIPALYSLLFFAIPTWRRLGEHRKNRRIKESNFRRRLIDKVISRPEEVDLEEIQPESRAELSVPISQLKTVKEKMFLDLVLERHVEVVSSPGGSMLYVVPDLKREKKDMEKIRSSLDMGKYRLGAKVFDTGEE